MPSHQYTVIVEPGEQAGYHVYVPALKGCHSYGETYEEALANIREAIELYLDVLREEGLPIPPDVRASQVEVAA